ncbi:MAG: RsbRD N-terminal domain-containing protein [Bacteroidetes bacterium]|nr:RsbRD N-terminal domain-containing protein [Bacteroidota bacterium]MBU1680992.1 RsbRD N-terminal domain-containing protein [Bacteroidota bacterium]MBU2506559.1 RsbRD N-terminal domain-containing protein [Bacteroidota bacterium]
MIEKIIPILKADLSKILNQWAAEARSSDHLKDYQKLPDVEFNNRIKLVIEQFISWLEAGAVVHEAESYFTKVGSERMKEGFPLTEVVFALYLIKKIIRDRFVEEEFVSQITGKEAITCITLLSNFFDLGVYFIVRGYTEKLYGKLDSLNKLSKQELDAIVAKESVEDEDWESDEFIWRHV